MESAQFIPRSQMVKLGALDGGCVGHQGHEQDQHQGRDRCRAAHQNSDFLISPDHWCRPLVRPRAIEGGGVVTLLALLAEPSGVHIVTGVTGTANHRRLDDVLRPDVAIGATDLRVGSQQWEARVGRMIEIAHLPAVRVVALGAFLAQPAVVHIVLGVAADAFLGRIVESLSGMTLAAGHDDMQTHERVFRLIVIEIHLGPLRRGMALLALLAQRATVWLVGPVAVDAFGSELLVFDHARVAHMTVQVGVRAFERKLEALQMVEMGYPPGIAVVAVRAGGTQPAGVLVIRFVAADAILGYRVLQVAAAMTVATADTGMPAFEGKARLARVVEFLRGPVSRRMTVGALGTLAALVNVIRQMAPDALLWRAFVMLTGVAGGARDFAMLVGEREGGLLVVEPRLLPHLRVMTRSAVGPEATPVNVVLAMTIDAGGGSFAIRRVGAMAAGAGHRLV